jgi:2'-5' RNA ligase
MDTVRAGPLGGAPRWVHVPNLHLTVRFLGDTPGHLVDGVARAVDGMSTDAHSSAGLANLAEVLRSEVSRFVALVRQG